MGSRVHATAVQCSLTGINTLARMFCLRIRRIQVTHVEFFMTRIDSLAPKRLGSVYKRRITVVFINDV
jgi:hypothetical protein